MRWFIMEKAKRCFSRRLFSEKGVFAEYFHVNDADGNLAHLPEGMDLAAAAMISDMVPTGFHGAELADIQFGDNVAVIGIGPVGLMAVAAAAIRGAAGIYAVGSRKNCCDLAMEFGADADHQLPAVVGSSSKSWRRRMEWA